MDVFKECKKISQQISSMNHDAARNTLIFLLDYLKKKELPKNELINHLIRETGLFPYLDPETALLEDRLVYEAFKVNTGEEEPLTLHREQSLLLKKLLEGKNIAISAPTSFGKSFVIDAFISIKRPQNIVIIVPTIALMDETRRRLHKKFGNIYKVITTPEIELARKNILIFPQERCFKYIDKITVLDMLIIDEFYKASKDFDKDRSPALKRAIIQLGKKASQKYYLAPNISSITSSPFTYGMEFIPLKFNTVVLREKDLSHKADTEEKKKNLLLNIITQDTKKTLIYAGTYSEIKKVSDCICEYIPDSQSRLLNHFSNWVEENYGKEFPLVKLSRKKTGIHNGRLHRSLSQIQICLFNDIHGLENLISTSSIIEGVNTAAENVIVWANKSGRGREGLNSFAYKNIIGRSGRMFRHFIGNIYLLDSHPDELQTTLDISVDTDDLANIPEEEHPEGLTPEQIAKVIDYKEEMRRLIGNKAFDMIERENLFTMSNSSHLLKIAGDMATNLMKWHHLNTLNSDDINYWDDILYKVIQLGVIPYSDIGGIRHRTLVNFIKVLTGNWYKTIPQLLSEVDLDVETFFKLERIMTFKMASTLSDINLLYNAVSGSNIDISPFISKLSHGFLPASVSLLEEYGLPRMVSKKVHHSRLIDMEEENTIHEVINEFNKIGCQAMKSGIQDLHAFEAYIIDYFYDGITIS